jgi:hypothetical protein
MRTIEHWQRNGTSSVIKINLGRSLRPPTSLGGGSVRRILVVVIDGRRSFPIGSEEIVVRFAATSRFVLITTFRQNFRR